MDNKNETLESINRKLSAIIYLLLKKEDSSIKEGVAALANTPLTNKEGAEILGISDKHFNKEKCLTKNKSLKRIQNKEENNVIENDQPTSQQQS